MANSIDLIVSRYGKKIEEVIKYNKSFNRSCAKDDRKKQDEIEKEARRIQRRYNKARNGLARIMALGQHKQIQELIKNSIGEDKSFTFYGAGYSIGAPGAPKKSGYGNVFIYLLCDRVVIEYGSSGCAADGFDKTIYLAGGVNNEIHFGYGINGIRKDFQELFEITPSYEGVEKFGKLYLDPYFKETSIDDEHEDSMNLLVPVAIFGAKSDEADKEWEKYYQFTHEIKHNWHPRRIAFQVLADCADDEKFEKYLSVALRESS